VNGKRQQIFNTSIKIEALALQNFSKIEILPKLIGGTK